MTLVHFQGKTFTIIVIQVYAPTTNTKEAEAEWFCEDLQVLPELTSKKDVLLTTGDWNAKAGTQEIPGVASKFGRGVQNEQAKVTVLPRKHTVIANIFQRHEATHGHHQMVNTEIRLIIFFRDKDGEALNSQQKQGWELTVAQIMTYCKIQIWN